MLPEAGDSPSRLQVSLKSNNGHKYDQIVALTQTNINESLTYHFTIRRPNLLRFNARAGDIELKGTIKPPQIDLVDQDRGDKAFYIITFKNGSQLFKYAPQASTNNDTERVREFSVDAGGWQIAFEVSFDLSQMSNVPGEVKAQVSKPDCYTVSQLVINFSSADALKFAWDKSKIVMPVNTAEEPAIRALLPQFVGQWLSETRMKTDPDSRNVLGYALTATDPRAVQPATPYFVPTAVRLLTIKHKTDPDYNAFVFAQGCNGRALYMTELPWSGELFYRAIGGTLLLAKWIFWGDYIRRTLSPINKNLKTVANGICQGLSGGRERLPSWVLSDSSTDEDYNDLSTVSGGSLGYDMRRHKDHHFEHDGIDGRPKFDTTFISTVKVTNSNTFTFERRADIKAVTSVAMEAFGVSILGGSATTNISYKQVTDFILTSIESTGKLNIETRNHKDVIDINVENNCDGKVIEVMKKLRMNALVDMLTNTGGITKVKKQIEDGLKEGLDKLSAASQDMTDVFNGQGKFVLSGGGSFDMKDPYFTNEGDLIVGLIHRK